MNIFLHQTNLLLMYINIIHGIVNIAINMDKISHLYTVYTFLRFSLIYPQWDQTFF